MGYGAGRARKLSRVAARVPCPVSFSMRSFVVPLDDTRRRAVPAGLTAHISPALARAVGFVDLVRRTENKECVAIPVDVRITLEFSLSPGDCPLPPEAARSFRGGLPDSLLK